MQRYEFHPQLVLRAPTHSFPEVVNEATIWASLHDARFLEALYLASPALYQECRRWQRGELTEARKVDRLLHTLTRYYLRTSSRCTPFGLFAGCAVVSWSSTTQLALADRLPARLTRLDMHYLCAVAQHLAGHKAIRSQLRYRPNTTLYPLGNEFRYIEYQYEGTQRINQLSAVTAIPSIQEALLFAQDGASYAELIAQLSQHTDSATATAFVETLIEAQVLVHELEPTITGEEFLTHIQQVLWRLSVDCATAKPLAQQLAIVQQHLAALDHPVSNSPARYEEVANLLAPFGVIPEPGKLFQTDVLLPMNAEATLATAYQPLLREALEVLARLTAVSLPTRLDDFRQRFEARYEGQEVPLLEALDNESGLSYTDYGRSSYSPLVHDLVLSSHSSSPATTPFTPAQQLLQHKLRHAAQQYEVELTPADVAGLPVATLPLAPSVAILFRLLDEGRILVDGAGGSSAVNLLGRFAPVSPAITTLVQHITAHEQARNPAVAFAEICHLPASRVGNLLRRPSFRALEIPYLAQSILPAEQQVLPQDLLISVREGQFILHSRKTGQRIIPRLSTAHNFTHEALPVYQFLCDLQTQGLQPHLSFDWESKAKFLPRLRYKQVVLAPASWHFEQADLQPLLVLPKADFAAGWLAFRQQWQLPRQFVLAYGDNELFVDAENDLLVRVWCEAVRQQPRIQLKEFLDAPAASPLHDAAGRPHTQQFIALLLRQGPSYPSTTVPHTPSQAVQRTFSLGSEWLYYKLYCGVKVADNFLVQVVGPLVAHLQALNLIDNWFFVRYADPDPHLRLRLHLPNPARLGEVIALVAEALAPATTIWKVQTETYQRELERYGTQTIAATEVLFGYQSVAVLTLLAEQAPVHWLWSLAACEELLTAFAYSLPNKLALLQHLRHAFAQEFGLDKTLKHQLDAKYRIHRPDIVRVMRQAAGKMSAPLAKIAQKINQLTADGQIPMDQLLASYLHMLINRAIPTDARLHELVIYDFLTRHYRTQLAQPPQD